MSAEQERLRTVFGLALCIRQDNLEVFGDLVTPYGLSEEQRALVRTLAATASEDDLRDFGLYLAEKP